MKAFLIIAFLGLALAEELNLEELVTRVLEESEHHHDTQYSNSTPWGLEYSKRWGTKINPQIEEINRISKVFKHAYDTLIERENIDEKSAFEILTRQLPAACQQPQLNCNSNSKYRSIEGICNNINNPRWGSSVTPFTRLLRANYDNGVDVPRGGFQSRLPNARAVSKVIHPDQNVVNTAITNMVPSFGQFLDHDMTLTPEGNRQCCSGTQDPDCWPIQISSVDTFYNSRRTPVRCLDFTRSTAFCFQTNSGQREQINVNTHFIDGSQVYGSTSTRALQLRTRSGGQLKTNRNLRGFLPNVQDVGTFNGFQGDFIAGDDRINENPVLASLHNLFLMEHNRIAQYIAQRRPGLSDEVIYQETRRIVGAELQQVTYNEYLPIVLGSNAMSRFNLNLGSQYTTYNPNLDPTIINSFATAAYRFGHSLVNGVQRLVSVPSQNIGSFQIRDNYFQSNQITQSNGQGYDWIMGGLMTQNSQAFDPFVTVDLSDFLFRSQANDFGSDLIARNIQRGRDHGLPSYYRFRQWCGLPAVSSDQFVKPAEVRQDAWTELVNSRLYQRPEDIDLFTGGLMETPVAGGLTGPTFNCIKANQFARSKEGDRYFFTHSGTPNTFNTGQIQALRARTLGDIMCQNSQLSQTTRNVFLIPSSGNTWIPCSASNRILNLDLFLP